MGIVNQGGNSTMLGHWRVVLKQAEESAKAGRLDEAIALAAAPTWPTTGRPCKLRGKWTWSWSGGPTATCRGRRPRRRASPTSAAAERFGAAPDVLATARLRLADRVAEDIRADLAAGEPDRVVERLDALAKQKVDGPSLRRVREAAEAWQAARAEARRGEFGRAAELLDRADRLAGDDARDALARRPARIGSPPAGRRAEGGALLSYPGRSPRRLAGDPRRGRGPLADRPRASRWPAGPHRAWQQIGAIGPQGALDAIAASLGGGRRWRDPVPR